MKRKRGVDDIEDDDWREKEIRDKLPNRKRRKKQQPVEEEDEEEFGGTVRDDDDFIVHGSQDFDELDDDEEDLVNKPETGIIEEIVVENFMCHKKLKVEFKSHINVITGRNGSGKSAIIIAIQAVLGGKKPRQSARIQDLIKEKEDGCFIRITLRNKGPDGYQRDKFGDKIIVERSITRRGSSSYKIMDHDETVHYRTKKELDKILRFFNIHVANPCVVMSQDRAKTFLTTAKGSEKYELFLEASQLKGMLEDFRQARDKRDKMDHALKVKNESLVKLKEELDAMEDEMKITETIGDLETDIEKMNFKLSWRMVFDVEAKIDRVNGKIQEEEEGLVEIKNELQAIEAKINGIREHDRKLKARLDEQFNKKRSLSDELHELRDQLRESRSHKTRIESKIGDLKTQKQNARKVIRKREERMRMIENRVSVSHQDEIRDLEENISKYKLRKEKSIKETEESKRGRIEAERKRDMAEDEYEDKTHRLNRLVKDIDQEKREIQRIVSRRKDKMNFFENNITRLLQVIQSNRNGFDDQPIGPVWMYMNVREAKWACGIEVYLNREKDHFIVHSEKDAKILKSLCRKHNIGRTTVIVYPFVNRVHEIPHRSRVRSSLLTVDRQIKIDCKLAEKKKFKLPRGGETVVNATIRNYLMDYRFTERVICVEDRNNLERIFFNEKPDNAFRGLSRFGTQVEWINRNRFISSKYKTKVEFFGEEKDDTHQINTHKQRIEDLRSKEKPMQTEVRKKRKEMNTLRKGVADFKQKEKKFRIEVRKLEKIIKRDMAKCEEIREAEENEDEDKEEELEIQRSKIEKVKNDINKMNIKISSYEKELEELRPEDMKIKDQMSQKKSESEKIDGVVDELTKQSREKTKELDVEQRKEHTWRLDDAKKNKVIRILKERARSLESERQVMEGNAQTQHTQTQGENNERPGPIPETTEELENLIRELERRIKREEAKLDGRAVEVIKEIFNSKMRKYNQVKHYLEVGGQNLKAIKRGLVNRHKKWKEIRMNYSKVAAIAFNRSLTQKGHSGRLYFNFEEEKLTTEIQLSKTEERKVRDTKSLSGGEKSFSTLALLTAMWEVAESPFRALDEVDIFMDNLYRKKSIDLLVKVSMLPKHINSQLIMVTPQSTKGFTSVKDVDKRHIHVIRMKDPVRDGMRQTGIDEYM